MEQSRRANALPLRSYHNGRKLSHMISISAAEVERRFGLMGIPNRFMDAEKAEFDTTSIVDMPDDVLVFPTPAANSGLNVLNLRQILGTDPSKQPSFFDHPHERAGRDFALDSRHLRQGAVHSHLGECTGDRRMTSSS